MLSLLVWPKVITLSGFYSAIFLSDFIKLCKNVEMQVNKSRTLRCLESDIVDLDFPLLSKDELLFQSKFALPQILQDRPIVQPLARQAGVN
jgi:hypothetical protein